MSLITLKDAVHLYSQEKRALSNSYGWYRKSAQHYGTVHIGGIELSAHKERGTWYVDETDLAEAIRLHREKIQHIEQNTDDYQKGIIHGNDGEILKTTYGGYQIRGRFRFVWSDVERYRKRSYGTWYCNSCNTVASSKHDRPECHLCSDWNGCGEDCTLSGVYCEKCGHRLAI
jgi:hypothetical protein